MNTEDIVLSNQQSNKSITVRAHLYMNYLNHQINTLKGACMINKQMLEI